MDPGQLSQDPTSETKSEAAAAGLAFLEFPVESLMWVWLLPDSHLLGERLLYRRKAVEGSKSAMLAFHLHYREDRLGVVAL